MGIALRMQTETHQRQRERRTPTAGMTWIPSGEFAMGSADFYPEERPVHAVAVDGFWIDTRTTACATGQRPARVRPSTPQPGT
jgi:formylglycine-generating enzyme required for sulfatase activity